MEIDLISGLMSKGTWRIEISLVLAWGSKLSWILCTGSKLTVFCVRAGNDLVSVFGLKLSSCWRGDRN